MAKKDIHIELVLPEDLTGVKFYHFGFTRTVAVSGLQKLLNNWIKYLLTPVGSNPNDLEEGTEFTSLIGSNVPLPDARDTLAFSIEKTNSAIKAYQRGKQLPLDEKFSYATITAYVEMSDAPGFSAQVLIRNAKNEGLQILLPTLEVND
jgi:hypothetical protein